MISRLSCIAYSFAYRPLRSINSSCGPCSVMLPSSTTNITSARFIVANRCAMTIEVLFLVSLSIAGFHLADCVASGDVRSSGHRIVLVGPPTLRRWKSRTHVCNADPHRRATWTHVQLPVPGQIGPVRLVPQSVRVGSGGCRHSAADRRPLSCAPREGPGNKSSGPC